MDVRAELIDILENAIWRLATAMVVDWPALLMRLETVQQEAFAQAATNGGLVASVVSAANVLTDCIRGAIPLDEVLNSVRRLDPGPGWETGLFDLLRRGARIVIKTDDTTAYSAMHWRTFIVCFGAELGAPLGNLRLQQDLWDSLQAGPLPLPLDTIFLADQSGTTSSWVTDDGDSGKKLQTTNPTRDVYDMLGLDWTGRSERIEAGVSKARAILFGCGLRIRERAAGSLHCPNSVDGWGNMLFVPRQPTGGAWPVHGSFTARPGSDDPCLPEAIHGPSRAARGEVAVLSLGEIDIGNRPLDWGGDAMRRALQRLRAEAIG